MPKFLLASLVFLLSCGASDPPAPPAAAPHTLFAPPADLTVNVRTYGALGDGATDDGPAFRAAFAAAVTSGADVYVPPGLYAIGRDGSAYYNLLVPPGLTVRGAGDTSMLRQLPGMGASVRLLQVNGADTTISDLMLDGNAVNQTVDEHRAGIFITAANARILRVTSQHFTGDGFYLYSGSTGARLYDCTAQDNRRNGVTLGGPIDAAWIRGGSYVRNLAQQIDSEPGYPGTVNNVTITDATIDSGLGDYAITVSGTSSSTRSHGWTVARNVVTGGIFVVWAEDVTVSDNIITSPGAKACVFVYRTNWKARIVGNSCFMTDPIGMTTPTPPAVPTPSYPSGIKLIGTGGTSQPDGILVARNNIVSSAPSGLGIQAAACGDIVIEGNVITGSNKPFAYGSGVYLRATDATTPFRSATVVGNTITAHGNRGIDVRGNGAAQLLVLRAVGNEIGTEQSILSIGISPDDGTHALQHGVYVENVYDTGVTSGRL